jgi:hypothetical protein
LISTFTIWGMVSAVDENNAHCIFRSSLGQYVAELPGRLIVGSIYSFLLWVMMFLFVLLPVGFWSCALVGISVCLFMHTITCMSAFGRVIMHSGAMGHQRVFAADFEKNLLPHSLHANLLAKARANLSKNTSILRQYRYNSRPIDHFYSEEELTQYMSASEAESPEQKPEEDETPTPRVSYQENDHQFHPTVFPPSEPRRRTDSTVRFADEVADEVTSSPPPKNISSFSSKDADDFLSSVPESGTPISQMSTISSTGELAADTIEKSKINQQQGTQKPPRPGIVRRVRSNTTTIDSANDPNPFYVEKPASKKPDIAIRPAPRPHPYTPARAESDTALSAEGRWFNSTPVSVDERRNSLPPANRSNSLPLPVALKSPGLSVLENAAKLQRQWRNSQTEGGRSSLQHPSTPTDRSAPHSSTFDSVPNLEQMWLNPGPTEDTPGGKESPLRSSAPTIDSSLARPTSSAFPETPPPQPLFQNSSSEALTSSRERANSSNSGALSLSEEDEAYLRDYGSFEQLDDEDDTYTYSRHSTPTEQHSLLEHDRLENGTAGYSSVASNVRKERNNKNYGTDT